MSRKSTIVAATLSMLLAAPLLTACGSDEDDAKEAAEKVFHAMGNYDAEGYCSLTTTDDGSKPLKDDQQQFDKCKQSLSGLAELDKDKKFQGLKNAKVKKATVDGDKATIKEEDVEGLPDDMKSKEGKSKEPLTMKKIGDKWYLLTEKSSAGSGSAPSAG